MHTLRNKTPLLHRVRRIGGQVKAIEKGLIADEHCSEILRLVATVRGATDSLMAEIMDEHIR